MRQILLSLLLAGCASTPKPLEPVTPVAPVVDSRPPVKRPPNVAPEVLEEAEHVLMFMVFSLDMGLADAMKMCGELGSELSPLEGKDQWFNCGGVDGYTVAVNADGKIMYVAIEGIDGWTVPALRSILGPEDEVSHGEELVECHWVKQPADGVGPDLDISLNLPKDGRRPFVGMKYRVKPPKSGTLNL